MYYGSIGQESVSILRVLLAVSVAEGLTIADFMSTLDAADAGTIVIDPMRYADIFKGSKLRRRVLRVKALE